MPYEKLVKLSKTQTHAKQCVLSIRLTPGSPTLFLAYQSDRKLPTSHLKGMLVAF